MRILGVDYGEKRTGIAISDALGMTAQGVKTIFESYLVKVAKEVSNIAKELDAEKIVVGLPKNMDGTIGFRGEATYSFIEELKKETDLPIITWDERLSTVSAIKSLNETNTRGKKRKDVVDTVAAMYILQNYLDSLI
ncbi:MAG: Holliday junction resolvase RuvX [Clostridia bacterium]|nr:Holliday junction resolvase RuvX [Clostridia bacterium]